MLNYVLIIATLTAISWVGCLLIALEVTSDVHSQNRPRGRRRYCWLGLTVSKPMLKNESACGLQHLKLKYDKTAFKFCFQIQLAPLQLGRLHAACHGGAVHFDSIKTRVESAPGFNA